MNLTLDDAQAGLILHTLRQRRSNLESAMTAELQDHEAEALRADLLKNSAKRRQRRAGAEIWLIVFSGFTLAGLLTSYLLFDILGAILPGIVFAEYFYNIRKPHK